MKVAKDAQKRVGESERLYDEQKSLDRFVAYSKSFDEFSASVGCISNSFKFNTKILVEVKGIGNLLSRPIESI
jgi:hypothetical protein